MPRKKTKRDGRGRPKKDRSYSDHGREKRLKAMMTDPMLETIASTHDENLRRDLVAQLFTKRENGEHVDSPLLTLPLPGSPMEYLMAAFQSRSKITLAIPFWQAFLLTAQKLAAADSHVVLPAGSKVCPAMYTIICSNTGECKTWVLDKLEPFWSVVTVPTPMSPQAAIKSVQRRDGKACLLSIDEYGSTWKRWLSKEDGMLFRELLLFAHTQKRFTGSLKDDEEAYTIEKPILSLLGMTQIDNFHRYFTPEDWESGFMPRCFVAVGPQRPEWEEGLDLDPIEKVLNEDVLPRFEKLFRETPIHKEYKLTVSAKGLAVWHSKKMTKEMGISMGYARRGLYGLYKFAHVWHLLNGKFSDEIDGEDMELAIKTLEIVWHDLKLLTAGGVSELADVTVKALKFATGCETGNQTERNCAQWLKCRRTALVLGVREVDKFNVRWILDVVEHNLHNVREFEEEKPENLDNLIRREAMEAYDYWLNVQVPAWEEADEEMHIQREAREILEDALQESDHRYAATVELLRKKCPQLTEHQRELIGQDKLVQARVRAVAGQLDEESKRVLEGTPSGFPFTEQRLSHHEFVRSYVKNSYVFYQLFDINSPVPSVEEIEAETDIVMAELAKPVCSDVDEFGLTATDVWCNLRIEIQEAWAEYKPANLLYQSEAEVLFAEQQTKEFKQAIAETADVIKRRERKERIKWVYSRH